VRKENSSKAYPFSSTSLGVPDLSERGARRQYSFVEAQTTWAELELKNRAMRLRRNGERTGEGGGCTTTLAFTGKKRIQRCLLNRFSRFPPSLGSRRAQTTSEGGQGVTKAKEIFFFMAGPYRSSKKPD